MLKWVSNYCKMVEKSQHANFSIIYSNALQTLAHGNYPHGRTNQNRWQCPEVGQRQRSSCPGDVEFASWAPRVKQNWSTWQRNKMHPAGALNYLAEQTIPPLKGKSSQICFWDSWAAHGKETQSTDCLWVVSCERNIKLNVDRMLFKCQTDTPVACSFQN